MRLWDYGVLPKYSRLSSNDAKIWHDFILQNPKKYKQVAYDVLVGTGSIVDEDTSDIYQIDYSDLTKKRIDVVGFTDDFIDIIEIKPRASGSALGQVLNYLRLYQSTYLPKIPVFPVIITDSLSPDDVPLFQEFKVTVWVVD